VEIINNQLLDQIQKAKKGDQSAFKYLLDGFWNVVYGFQIKRIKNEYEAEDIAIETFSKAFELG
jgi:RNA polymerase sigma-70 factor (ECF subfamily)